MTKLMWENQFFIEDIRAIVEGDNGAYYTYVYVHLKDLPKPVMIHIFHEKVKELQDMWRAEREKENT